MDLKKEIERIKKQKKEETILFFMIFAMLALAVFTVLVIIGG